MDSNTNLQEQRRLAALIQAQHDAGQDTSTDAARLAELVLIEHNRSLACLYVVNALIDWYDENDGLTGPHAGAHYVDDQTWNDAVHAAVGAAPVWGRHFGDPGYPHGDR